VNRGDPDGTVRREVLVVEEGQEDRLDRFVSERTGLSRTRVQGLIRGGMVDVDGRPALKSERLEKGSSVTVQVPPAEPVEILAEDLPLTVLFEDEDLLVVDKATGMVEHPAPGHRSGTLVNALLFHVKDLSGVGGRMRPGIVHRLDKDTSGLLVVAKSDRAHVALSDALKRRRVKRLYRAVCWGHLEESPITVDAPIGRDPHDRQRMTVLEGGRNAVTRARVRERWVRADLLDVALQTGRTHQIRVHMAHIGHPLVGDEVYGSGWARGMGGPDRIWARQLERMMHRQFLHAAELVFDHPVTGLRMRFRSPLPEDLASVAAWARSESGSP
jgi:23S rRNA pseudouridine1911/1915/1917 synthase